MGEAISTLVFRPPTPTKIRKDRYFFIDVPIESRSVSCVSTTTCGMVPPTESTTDAILTESHKIPAFYIRRRGARITFLFSHGNAEDLGMMYNRMKDMARILGVNVLAYDYTGYGLSTGGIPSEAMCYRNIEAAYKYLRYDRTTPASHIVLYGRSLGSGPSCYLARKTAEDGESVAGLILHSPFLSIYRIVMDFGFNMVGDMFKNSTNARKVNCPVLVMHGKEDEVIPFWHADHLLQSFPPQYRAQPFWVSNLGHNHIEVHERKKYVQRITTFLDQYVPSNRRDVNPDLRLSKCHNYKPAEIPESERYVPESRVSRFIVNKTWVKHGRDIISEAISSKTSKKKKSRRKKTDKAAETGASSIKLTCDATNTSPEVMPNARTNEFEQQRMPSHNALTSDGMNSTASRFVVTRDRVIEDTGSETEDEQEKEQQEQSNTRWENF